MSQIFPFDAQVLDTTSGNLFTGQLNQSNPEDSYIFTIDSPSNFIADLYYNFNDGNAGSGAFNFYSPDGDIFNGKEFVAPETVTTGFFLSGNFATSLSELGTYTIRTVGAPLTSYELTLLLTDISDNRIINLTYPQSSAVDSGIPTNLPANTVDNGFYNLSDGNDSIELNTIPQTANIPIRGLSGNDYIRGISTGNNNINGNQGSDTIFGGSGNDFLRGGKGDDVLQGGSGSNDTLNGNDGNDTVYGEAGGNNLLRGGKGDDLLRGGVQGNDTLIGDLGQDLLINPGTTYPGGAPTRPPRPGEPEVIFINPMPDVYVLRGGDAAASSIDKADAIFRFQRGDKIGLTDGITFDNLRFKLVELSLKSSFINFNPRGNDDGFISSSSTAIQVGDNGPYLGMVYGRLPTDFNRSLFVDASSILAQG